MSLFFDLLKVYLIHCVMIFITPISTFNTMLSSDKRLTDCISVGGLLIFIGLSIGFSVASNEEFSTKLIPLLFLPLFLYVVASKISWFITRVKVTADILICQSVIFIGINCMVATIGFAFGFFLLKSYNPKLYSWMFNTDVSAITQTLISNQDAWEKQWNSNPGLKYFVFSTYTFGFLSLIYWLSIAVSIAKYLQHHWVIGLIAGIVSSMLCLASGLILVFVF
ncbi:hypothetical protein [Raoultella planticola]|jgi:hypothetical protein|uniref:hypothetical protein n=1 Tax=Raoultella planticola TaxID=575 RepID=UPI000935D60F|nr:hypothetical protein [Raoultella planticola]RNO00787.1 hypothetical protein BL127_00002910 [Raoultella planticola]HDH7820577.1 hypothetical protein [Raoultella planticola]HEM8819904.1 hypothetical protein [Raoultella planticola]